MSQKDNKRFTAAFKNFRDEDKEENNYEKAMKILLSWNLIYQKSLENHEEHQAAQVIDKVANDYRKIVDSKPVNNYAEEFLGFQKNIAVKLSASSIETGLVNPDKYIEMLECKGEYETCKNNEIRDADLKGMFKSRNEDPAEELSDTRNKLETSYSDPLMNDSVSEDALRQINSAETLLTKPNFRKPEDFVSNDSNYKEIPTFNCFFPKTSLINKDSSSAASIEKSISNIGNALFKKSRNNPPDNSAFVPKTAVSKKQEEEKEEVNKFPDFRSSREVLLNNMKISKVSAAAEPNYGNGNYNLNTNGNIKKSLGGRRGGGVNKPFSSPFANENNNTNSAPAKEEIVDERLKNIDPKMVELIQNEIMDKSSHISWDDIAGLNYAKVSIKEAVVLPILRPDIFTGLRRPPKGILLFGPPGTGKTLIGKCIASQSKSTFFSISASSLTSKWIGEGEKMVRALFAVASMHQPAVVFIDEIDSLLSQRSDTEHESSRRLKTEFLVQLDGAATGEDDLILIVAATNRPQELDEAARRRFTKRLYIPLPEYEARVKIIKNLMDKERHELADREMLEIGKLTDGFSGADMKVLCQEAAMGPIREIAFSQISSIQANAVRPTNFKDFKEALTRVRASVSQNDLGQYVQWDQTYGSGLK